MTETSAPVVIDGLTIHTRPTSYSVSAVPEDPYDGLLFEIEVQYTGGYQWAKPRPEGRQWAVRLRGHRCLSKSKTWDYESIPSEREDDWLAEHRFDLPTALRLAAEMAPTVTVNGFTPRDAIARQAARTPDGD